MKIFATKDIKDIDAATVEQEGISSYDLMERASRALTKEIEARWTDKDTRFVVFAGSGEICTSRSHNGVTACAAAVVKARANSAIERLNIMCIKSCLNSDCYSA